MLFQLSDIEIRVSTRWNFEALSWWASSLEEPKVVSREDTYITLLLGHVHSMHHIWGLQHDGVIGLPFLLDKLLFVICLHKARIAYENFVLTKTELLSSSTWKRTDLLEGL